jgi:hypothetical protein
MSERTRCQTQINADKVRVRPPVARAQRQATTKILNDEELVVLRFFDEGHLYVSVPSPFSYHAENIVRIAVHSPNYI